LEGLLAVYARKLPQIGREDNNCFTSMFQLLSFSQHQEKSKTLTNLLLQ
jgi:hypothetical protein